MYVNVKKRLKIESKKKSRKNKKNEIKIKIKKMYVCISIIEEIDTDIFSYLTMRRKIFMVLILINH